jgi:hypothetical protein
MYFCASMFIKVSTEKVGLPFASKTYPRGDIRRQGAYFWSVRLSKCEF